MGCTRNPQPMARALSISIERWPVAGTFAIARGAKTEAVVVLVGLVQGAAKGHGECVPYGRYGETPTSVVAQIESVRDALERGADKAVIQTLLPAGAARNAVDCALWDLEAKQHGRRIWDLAGLAAPKAAVTALTISVADPETMAANARRLCDYPLLKVKLGGEGDPARIAAVRAAAPAARLIADANEAWTPESYRENTAACVAAGVELIEQPLPADALDAMRRLPRPIPVCADENAHDRAGLAALRGAFDAVNIKLDKTGGLTEAIAMAHDARAMGFKIMVGCMLSTSLSMAQAMTLASLADWIDLDGPLLLARDRSPGLHYQDGLVHPPSPKVFG